MRKQRRAFTVAMAVSDGNAEPTKLFYQGDFTEPLAGPWKFAQHGLSGQWASELMPHPAKHLDDLCFIKSLHCDSSNHAFATYQMNTGVILGDRPSVGSWLTYGLGSENQHLPARPA